MWSRSPWHTPVNAGRHGRFTIDLEVAAMRSGLEPAMNSECKTRERAKWKSRRRRQRHRVNGLCLECRRRSISNRRFCVVHLAKARTKAKHEYAWRVANGVCVKCGTPKEEGRVEVNCISCASKAAEKERRRRSTNRRSIRFMRGITEAQESNRGISCAADGGREDERNIA